jgi:hypothetical protein
MLVSPSESLGKYMESHSVWQIAALIPLMDHFSIAIGIHSELQSSVGPQSCEASGSHSPRGS